MSTEETSEGLMIKYEPLMSVEKLDYNELNPRCTKLIPQKELKLDELCNSILQVGGILVPLVVFPKNDRFVVLDGERRLRAAKKLKMPTVPVNIIPGALSDSENLANMFNIHLQRERWNTAARAVSLGTLVKLAPNMQENQIKAMAGMGDAEYRNAKRILSFQKELQDKTLRGELNPFYLIEMEKAIENINRYLPGILDKYSRAKIVDSWISKIERRIIKNVTHFRIVGRICRNLDVKRARDLVRRLVEEKDYSFAQAWDEAEEEVVGDLLHLFESRAEKFINDLRQLPIVRQSPSEVTGIRIMLEKVLKEIHKKIAEIPKH